MIFASPWPPLQHAPACVADAVLGAARQFGDKPALIEGETGRTLSYRQLVHGAERVAAGLAQAGLEPGQPLALALPNSIDFALAFFGAMRAGAWVVPINPVYTPAEMEHQIHDSGARFLVTVPERAADLAPTVDAVFEIGGRWNELLECGGVAPEVRPSSNGLAMLPYSSGTTGKPKGVMLTHANVLANLHQFTAAMGLKHHDVLVNVFPLYHVAGLNCILNAHLAVGATVVLMRRFHLEGWLALIGQYRATAILIPPPVVLAIVKSPSWDRFRLDSVQRAGCGAAPLGADLQKAFEDRTGLVLRQIWGMTEATALISADVTERAGRKLGSCGYLAPSIEARVVDVATLQELAPQETGEIWVRGPNIMQGYWKQPAAATDTSERWLDAYRRHRLYRFRRLHLPGGPFKRIDQIQRAAGCSRRARRYHPISPRCIGRRCNWRARRSRRRNPHGFRGPKRRSVPRRRRVDEFRRRPRGAPQKSAGS